MYVPYEVVVHEPKALYLREIFRLHHICRTPCPRLAGDSLNSFALAFMYGLRHVVSFRSPPKGTTLLTEDMHIVPYFHEHVNMDDGLEHKTFGDSPRESLVKRAFARFGGG